MKNFLATKTKTVMAITNTIIITIIKIVITIDFKHSKELENHFEIEIKINFLQLLFKSQTFGTAGFPDFF